MVSLFKKNILTLQINEKNLFIELFFGLIFFTPSPNFQQTAWERKETLLQCTLEKPSKIKQICFLYILFKHSIMVYGQYYNILFLEVQAIIPPLSRVNHYQHFEN